MPNRLENPGHAHRGELGGQHRLLPARRHEGHGREVVDFVGLGLLEDAANRGGIEQVALEQLNAVAEMFDALEVLGAGAAHHAANAITLVQKQLREIASRPVR